MNWGEKFYFTKSKNNAHLSRDLFSIYHTTPRLIKSGVYPSVENVCTAVNARRPVNKFTEDFIELVLPWLQISYMAQIASSKYLYWENRCEIVGELHMNLSKTFRGRNDFIKNHYVSFKGVFSYEEHPVRNNYSLSHEEVMRLEIERVNCKIHTFSICNQYAIENFLYGLTTRSRLNTFGRCLEEASIEYFRKQLEGMGVLKYIGDYRENYKREDFEDEDYHCFNPSGVDFNVGEFIVWPMQAMLRKMHLNKKHKYF